MKKMLTQFTTAGCLLASGLAFAEDAEVINKQIVEHCRSEWLNDYRMQEYCHQQQASAAASVLERLRGYDEDAEEGRIASRCMDEWQAPTGGYDWRMVQYCFRQQLTAYESALQAAESEQDGEVLAAINRFCQNEWPDDYRMQEYCHQQQTEAERVVTAIIQDAADDSEESRIIQRCAGEWQTSTGGYDWRMVRYCAEQQIGALQRLR